MLIIGLTQKWVSPFFISIKRKEISIVLKSYFKQIILIIWYD